MTAECISVHTRDLSPSEMLELFDFVENLIPLYRFHDSDRDYQAKNGGKLTIGFYPQHSREAVYAKTKWG